MFYYCSTLCTLFKVLWSTDACCNLRRSVSTLHLEYTTNCSAPLLFIFACAIHELPRFIRVPLRPLIFLCRGWCTSPITSISIINRNLLRRMSRSHWQQSGHIPHCRLWGIFNFPLPGVIANQWRTNELLRGCPPRATFFFFPSLGVGKIDHFFSLLGVGNILHVDGWEGHQT